MPRSPLRYPGGKQKLLPHILPLLTTGSPATYAEPFVGGGSVALAVAEALPGTELTLNDLHPNVAAFWRTVVADPEPLIEWIYSVQPSTALFHELLHTPYPDDLSRAAVCLYLNRASWGGTSERPYGGAEASPEQHSRRWYPERSASEIRAAHLLLRGRTEVTQRPFHEVPWAERNYLDPPYVTAGSLLYTLGGWSDEHEILRLHLRGRTGWVLSYDDHPAVRELYADCTIQELPTYYTQGGVHAPPRHTPAVELLITP